MKDDIGHLHLVYNILSILVDIGLHINFDNTELLTDRCLLKKRQYKVTSYIYHSLMLANHFICYLLFIYVIYYLLSKINTHPVHKIKIKSIKGLTSYS